MLAYLLFRPTMAPGSFQYGPKRALCRHIFELGGILGLKNIDFLPEHSQLEKFLYTVSCGRLRFLLHLLSGRLLRVNFYAL